MQRLHGKRAFTNNHCTRVICSCISQTPAWGPGGGSCCCVELEQPPKEQGRAGAAPARPLLRVLPSQEHPWEIFYNRLGRRRAGQR